MARLSPVPTGSRSRSNALLNSSVIGSSLKSHQSSASEYVDWRCAQTDKRATKSKGRTIKPSTAKRELVTLSAALNWCLRNKRLDRPVVVMLPKVAKRRERYLTRDACCCAAVGRARLQSRWHPQPLPYQPTSCSVHPDRLYTGTRHDAILRLQWMAKTSGGWFDLESGVLYRRPQDAIETNKRPLADPAAAHAAPSTMAKALDPVRDRV